MEIESSTLGRGVVLLTHLVVCVSRGLLVLFHGRSFLHRLRLGIAKILRERVSTLFPWVQLDMVGD